MHLIFKGFLLLTYNINLPIEGHCTAAIFGIFHRTELIPLVVLWVIHKQAVTHTVRLLIRMICLSFTRRVTTGAVKQNKKKRETETE